MNDRNGVDTDFFEPNVDRASPFRADEAPIVFTGAMNYWPNVDAVVWFADELMPEIRRRRPDVRFYVVGMNPAPEVKALAERHAYVTVTGKVDDVRPYLQHARVFVAPLRIARGIQNKVLEAMAMQCASIVSSGTLTGVRATPGTDLEAAATGAEFVARTLDLLEPSRARAIGRSARARVLRDYNWDFWALWNSPEMKVRREHVKNGCFCTHESNCYYPSLAFNPGHLIQIKKLEREMRKARKEMDREQEVRGQRLEVRGQSLVKDQLRDH